MTLLWMDHGCISVYKVLVITSSSHNVQGKLEFPSTIWTLEMAIDEGWWQIRLSRTSSV